MQRFQYKPGLVAAVVLAMALAAGPVSAATTAVPVGAREPASEQLASDAAAATTRSTIPSATPSADSVIADAQRAAIGQLDPSQLEEEGGFPLTWAWIALAGVLMFALASGDSRLRMQGPDHPDWERHEAH